MMFQVIILILVLSSRTWSFTLPRRSHHRPHQQQRHSVVRLSDALLSPQQLGAFEALPIRDVSERRKVNCYNLLGHPDGTSSYIPFETAWDLQRHLFDICHAQDQDSVILLQHSPVYTLGTASDPTNILDQDSNKIPVVRMDRGGQVTYHGPGQLVVYPVLQLQHYKQDIHWYMRALEEVVIRAVTAAGLAPASKARRHDAYTGVWMDDDTKVAAVGIKCRKWITQHGIAVNITPECLAPFSNIIPCGIQGQAVGCLHQYLKGDPITVSDFAVQYMIPALEEVFQMELLDKELDLW